MKRKIQQLEIPPRTVRHFVKYMIKSGRTKEQVRSVACSTRWSSEMEKVLSLADKYLERKNEN